MCGVGQGLEKEDGNMSVENVFIDVDLEVFI